MTCRTCIFFIPYRDPITGRVHPSKPGHCTAPVVLSMAQDGEYPQLWRARTFADRVAEDCRRYEESVREERKPERKERELFT